MRNLIPIFAVAVVAMMSASAEATRPGYPYVPRGPVTLNSTRRNDLFFYGRELCSKHEFALALEYFKRAIVIQDRVDDDALVGEAECLWHLKREPEALAIFADVQRRAPLCDFASLTKAAVLMESGKYDAALEACDYLEDHSVDGPEKACLLRSRIYQKQNHIVKAQEQAQRAFYHCQHLGQSTSAAEERLKELNCTPVYIVNVQMNDVTFSAIQELASLKPKVSQADLQRIFGRPFEELNKSGQYYYLTSIKNGTLFPNVQLCSSVNRDSSNVVITVNPDLTSITQDEIEAKFGHDYKIEGTTTDRSTDEGTHMMQYNRTFGTINFCFETHGSKCLRALILDLY